MSSAARWHAGSTPLRRHSKKGNWRPSRRSTLPPPNWQGERIESILSHAPGNGEPIGGIKVNTANGWFAARPSGTENLYKIYAESFKRPEHLQRILQEAQSIVDAAIEAS